MKRSEAECVKNFIRLLPIHEDFYCDYEYRQVSSRCFQVFCEAVDAMIDEPEGADEAS